MLVVPPSVEPDTVVAAAEYCLIDGAPLTDQVQIESVVTVVDADTILADTSTMEALDQRGRAAAGQDGRGVAETVIRQMEGADTILVHAVGVDRYRIAEATALSERLAPWARVLVAGPDAPGPTARLPLHGRLRGRIRYSPDVPEAVARGLAGFEVGECAHQPDCGVVSTLFHARRPFHPARLHAALPSLSGSALRVRGHSWISTQPDLVIGWDGAGGSLTLGTLDRWLAAVPDEQWPKAGPQRQVAATLEWDPYFGDRSTRLAFIGFELDTVQLHEQLQSCLLSDDELADGQERWSRLPDPFGDSFTAHEDPPVVDTRA
ncbi:hypothetical protein NUM_06260 [Actinocatenispora comari]|uniref:CobW C-terminal domain-containing protein n=1 Tax=Actinocatenispora comari TaxID=2807577 RepID=A0A8J4EIL2_9ACTN|nr:hypothetical protein NUM_06260 [Actinocatenispora comari]